jgi:alkylation response protein AidB-like acyl-CoA dehydrogenase
MNLQLSKDHQLIKTSVREFLDKECPKEIIREIEESKEGHSEVLWRKMAELGWMSMAIPEEYGGLGGTSPDFMEVVIILEEMGFSLLVGPFFSTVALGVPFLLNGGTASQKKAILPAVADGRLKVSLAMIETSAAFESRGIEAEAVPDGDTYKISGRKLFVEDGQVADYFICVARTERTVKQNDGITLFLIDAKNPRLTIKAIPTIGLERQCEVQFRDVMVSKDDVLGEIGGGWGCLESVLERANVGRCAQMLGGMEACLAMTNAYVKKRMQYGRTIGSFQAIQHYLANLWIDTVTSRDLVYKAAGAINAGLPCRTSASMVKAWVGKAFRRAAERSVQMHGAIGTTREHDIGLYYRQAKAWDLSFGSAENHLSLMGRALGNS